MSGPRYTERRRVGLAFSPGGHKAELDRALDGIVFADCFHITFAGGRAPAEGARTHFVCHPRRSVRRTLLNALQTLVVLARERPAVLISTGADVAAAAVILAKCLGIKTVFIETGGTIEPSLTGRLVYRFSDLFVVQWPEKLAHFPKAVLASGPLL